MNKKAFTLAELLAVVAILGVIALIVFPVVNQSIKESKEQAFEEQKNLILRGARSWGLENTDRLSKTSEAYVALEELKKAGYIEKKDVINPKTEKEMNGCIIITYDADYKQYKYDYEEVDCSEYTAVPIITLKGDTNMTVGKDETFIDPGYTATYKGNDVSSSVKVTGTVKTDTVGTYTVEYSVTCDGKSAKEIRTVNVELLYRTFRQVMEPLLGAEVNNDDPDQNLRYMGADPNNYVEFNGDLWRIIGLFSNESGEQPKLIQNESYHNDIEWDDDSNDWTTSTLKSVLNTTFLNEIDAVSKSYIDQNYNWHIGAVPNTEANAPFLINRGTFYEYERGSIPAAGSSDGSVMWQGAIGIIYASDYGYSTSGDKAICDIVVLYDWSRDEGDNLDVSYTNGAAKRCRNKAWLYDTSYMQWIMTGSQRHSRILYSITKSGGLNISFDTSSYVENYETSSAWPTLFLKPEVVIIDGSGTSTDPYILDII